MDLQYTTVPARIKTIQNELNNEVIGLSKMMQLPIKLTSNNSGKNRHSFELQIPFASTHLKWEVIFSNEDANFAPDFDFATDQFLTDPDIDVIEKHLPALHNWDINNPKCLYNVITEILCLYKRHQIDRLQVNKYEHLYREYLMLTEEMDIPVDDIEVHIDQSDCVTFLFQMPIDTSILPPYLGKYFTHSDAIPEMMNPGRDSVMIRASYVNQKLQTAIWLSPHLEEVIGTPPPLRMPFYRKDLRDYITDVRTTLNERLSTVSNNYKLRNQFVSTMLAYQGRSIIEYDNVTFSKMTLLLEAQDNNCLVIIQLGRNFDKPILQLRSLHSERNNKPVMEQLNYPYHPDASIEETVKKILSTVYCFLTTYKAESNHHAKNELKNEAFSYSAALRKT